MKYIFACVLLLSSHLPAQQGVDTGSPDTIAVDQLSREITDFLGREISAHAADVRSLDPPQERVVGALATGEFSWGTFMRALASYSALSGERALAGRDVPQLVGQIGLIESRNGGKTFAQLYA